MKIRSTVAFGLTVWATVACAVAQSYDFSALDLRISNWVNAGLYPGAAVLVAKDNHVIYEKCFGGYGLSDVPVEGKKFSHAEDLDQLMEALRVKKAHLVGLSLGSFVVGAFLALHPQKVLSATVAAGGVYDGPNGVVDYFAKQNADKKGRSGLRKSKRCAGTGLMLGSKNG